MSISFQFLDGQSICLDHFIGYHGHCNIFDISTWTTWLEISTDSSWSVWWIESCFLVNCIELHHFRLCSQRWRSCQSFLVTSAMATVITTLLFYILGAYSSYNSNGSNNENSILSLVQNIIATYILTVPISTIAALIFESPTVAIEKWIFSGTLKVEHQNGANEAIKMNETIQQNNSTKKDI